MMGWLLLFSYHTSLNPVPNAQVCVFDGTYYKITTTKYISKTSLYTILLGSFWGNLYHCFNVKFIFSSHSNIFCEKEWP